MQITGNKKSPGWGVFSPSAFVCVKSASVREKSVLLRTDF